MHDAPSRYHTTGITARVWYLETFWLV